jgi:hypothetical protein
MVCWILQLWWSLLMLEAAAALCLCLTMLLLPIVVSSSHVLYNKGTLFCLSGSFLFLSYHKKCLFLAHYHKYSSLLGMETLFQVATQGSDTFHIVSEGFYVGVLSPCFSTCFIRHKLELRHGMFWGFCAHRKAHWKNPHPMNLLCMKKLVHLWAVDGIKTILLPVLTIFEVLQGVK